MLFLHGIKSSDKYFLLTAIAGRNTEIYNQNYKITNKYVTGQCFSYLKYEVYLKKS